jgi:diguanylate cyclase (GGDEF)-like protein
VSGEFEIIHADELAAAEAEARAEQLAAALAEARLELQDAGERLVALEGLRQRAIEDYELQLQHARRELGQARDALGAEMARRVRTEDELRQTADSDPLTGLVSPRVFVDRVNMAVAQAQRQGGRLGVLALDVDGFADINESLGRQVGDDLLRSVAALLVQSLRQVDTVARLAGDEFSLLLPGLKEPEDALRVAEKLRLALCSPLSLGGHDLLVTASLGIALYPDDGPDTDALLASAQVAARQVRAAGGDGCRLHAPQSAARAAERARLESELRRALVKGELLLHYQPALDTASGRPCAVEAFLRWRRPAGLIDAGEFLGLADSTGLTLPLGQWALEAATRAVQRWRASGLELGVTVNVSARQIEHPALPRLVARALRESGLPATALTLEVPEADLLRLDRPALAERLAALRADGVRIGLGNFGLGETSVKRLQRLPLDALKIDRTVVAGLGSNREHERLAQGAVVLARALGLRVSAEGVDSEAARVRLVGWGCHEVQGRMVSTPLPEQECRAFLAAALLPVTRPAETPAGCGAPVVEPAIPSAPNGRPVTLAPSTWPWPLLTAPPAPLLLEAAPAEAPAAADPPVAPPE